MLSTSKSFLEVTLSEETESEESNNRMELVEEDMVKLSLGSRAEDADHGRLYRKRARAKKVGNQFVCSTFVLRILTLRFETSGTSWCLCRWQC